MVRDWTGRVPSGKLCVEMSRVAAGIKEQRLVIIQQTTCKSERCGSRFAPIRFFVHRTGGDGRTELVRCVAFKKRDG